MLENLVSDLCGMLRIPPLERDPRGVYEIVFDDNLDIEILSLSGTQFLIRAKLSDLPVDEHEHDEYFRKYLQYNLLNLHGQFCSISLDPVAGAIWLYQLQRDDRIDARQFYKIVGDFVTALEWWRKIEGVPDVTSPAQISPMNFIHP